MRKLGFTVESHHGGERLDRYLSIQLKGELSRTQVKQLIERRAVQLNDGCAAKANALLNAGDQINIELDESTGKEISGESFPFEIAYEDNDVLIINKEAGRVVHPGPGHRTGTLVHALVGQARSLSNCGGWDRPGIVHRLDKDTSGLIMIAKNNLIHRQLSALFKARLVQKTYIAFVAGRVRYEEGHIDKPLGRHPKKRLRMAVVEGGRASETHYKVLERFHYSTLLEIRPKSGRTHQIRTHMAYLGHPVMGDVLYGYQGKAHRLALHAKKLEFDHPRTNKRVSCEIPLPQDLIMMAEEERRR